MFSNHITSRKLVTCRNTKVRRKLLRLTEADRKSKSVNIKLPKYESKPYLTGSPKENKMGNFLSGRLLYIVE